VISVLVGFRFRVLGRTTAFAFRRGIFTLVLWLSL
jgi:hypothetical protein